MLINAAKIKENLDSSFQDDIGCSSTELMFVVDSKGMECHKIQGKRIEKTNRFGFSDVFLACQWVKVD